MAVLAAACVAPVRAAEEPDPHELLRVARVASTQQTATLRGQLRSGAEKAPFTLDVDFGKLRFLGNT